MRNLALAVLAGLGIWAAIGVQSFLSGHAREIAERDAKIQRLEGDLATLRQENAQLRTALRFLKVDHRLARIEVLSQEPAAGDPPREETTLRWQEIGREGQPLGPARTLTLQGRKAYVEAQVIKFQDGFVEGGDALRGTSLCLFRRIFGEFQEPREGVALDPVGVRPLPYSPEGADPQPPAGLWERFWDLANDPGSARQAGVRAIHGEAPFMELRPGKSYRVELRASGGLSIVAE